ncbi:succinate--hydroxymethylglutarate CoA-transferase-like [Acanthaster planci]|uniref:Succinate--hydroxymethylglutarate CoA-transferase-like n=1 Tax=Acanthaster planci TaxID=133434 RepID=A0A8B7XH71_ACAPL|nr:succinate--hydroxymethylglutarate CoA-transferase-like [Acanthaster planci]XP_022080144.1 succinate--hydroxymethylglutarate CoA-transferase-like [Acanthaster planci]
MILGDLGADVIKVERPGSGDDTRLWGPPFVGDQSCYFLSINRNKKSICVNLRHPEGLQIIKKMVTHSDVLVENYLPGKLDELGLGYETLKEISPSLIYCSITGYGPDGPYASRGGYDVVAAAMGGLIHITGPEDGEPVRVGVAMTDLSTGLFAYGAILAALLHRERTGLGQKIDCNLLSTQVAIMSHIGANYLMAGMEAKRWGTGHGSIVPYQAFKTSDGRLLIVGAGNNEHFKTLCKVLEMEELVTDERYTSNELRVINRDSLITKLSARFQEKELSDWVAAFEETCLPFGPVQSLQQVFQDPQVIHNKMIQEFNHPTVGNVRVPGPPVGYSTIQTDVRLSSPQLGEHTDQVLSEMLGYDRDQIQELEASGAIGTLQPSQ